MAWNDHIDPLESERNEFLQTLIDLKRLDGAAKGIAERVLKEGEQGLSDKQRFVYETYIIGDYANLKCKRCLTPIPLNEAICAKEDNECYCASCANAVSKDN